MTFYLRCNNSPRIFRPGKGTYSVGKETRRKDGKGKQRKGYNKKRWSTISQKSPQVMQAVSDTNLKDVCCDIYTYSLCSILLYMNRCGLLFTFYSCIYAYECVCVYVYGSTPISYGFIPNMCMCKRAIYHFCLKRIINHKRLDIFVLFPLFSSTIYLFTQE